MRNQFPRVIFATRHPRMFEYFSTFIRFARWKHNVLYEIHNVEGKTDDEVVRYLRAINALYPADLFLVGVEGHEATLYHDGIDGKPMGFVPYGKDYESFATEITRLLGR